MGGDQVEAPVLVGVFDVTDKVIGAFGGAAEVVFVHHPLLGFAFFLGVAAESPVHFLFHKGDGADPDGDAGRDAGLVRLQDVFAVEGGGVLAVMFGKPDQAAATVVDVEAIFADFQAESDVGEDGLDEALDAERVRILEGEEEGGGEGAWLGVLIDGE